ncbi:hypothetical protein CYMTET_35294, partial [Cymbomonas tetramitiformis]
MYGTISKLACVLSVAIFVLYLFRPPTPEQIAAGLTPYASKLLLRSLPGPVHELAAPSPLCPTPPLPPSCPTGIELRGPTSSEEGRPITLLASSASRATLCAGMTLAVVTTMSFLLGAFCSGLSGYIGMWVSVRANVRVAGAARRTAREALQVALRSGGFSGIMVVGMTVLGIGILFSTFFVFFGVLVQDCVPVPLLLVGYGFGASFVALFAQLGGGIYTKAADVGADLVGKVEAGIPEDDPRNPAVIADLVGDNVGDCSARGADLFESIGAEIISAMILGGSLARQAALDDTTTMGLIMFPLVVHTMDLVVSAVGIMSVKSSASPGAKQAVEDPYEVMKAGYNISIMLAVVGFGAATYLLLDLPSAPGCWINFFGCGMLGIATAYSFMLITQYYTDYKYKPVRLIAEASTTGHGTNIIAG